MSAIARHLSAISFHIVMGLTALSFAAGLLVKTAAIRLSDLQSSVVDRTEQKDGYRIVGLISRYQLIQQRLISAEAGNDYINETKLMLALGRTLPEDLVKPLSFSDRSVASLMNAANYLIGVPVVVRYDLSHIEQTLERAYMLELTRNYASAAREYGIVIQDSKSEKRNYALLHRGFCLSLVGSTDAALADLTTVEESTAPDEYKLTARMLSDLIRRFRAESERISKLPDSEQKGERLFYSSLYSASIDVFSRLEARSRTERGRFFLGRAYEESGKIEPAVSEYQALIKLNAQSVWSRLANRRLMILGMAYEADPSYIESAMSNLPKVQDESSFYTRLKSFQLLANKNRVKKKRIAVTLEKDIWPSFTSEMADKLVSEEYNLEEHGLFSPAIRNISSSAAAIFRKSREASRPRGLNFAAAKTKEERTNLIKSVRQLDKIATTDGSVLVGVIISENSERIVLFTILGNITVKKTTIAVRSKIAGN